MVVAQACLNHSVSGDHKKVIVQKEHVKKVVGFYRKVLKKLQLREYKRDREGKLKIKESEFTKITKELGELDYKILESLKTGGKSSTVLAGEMGVSKRTIKEHYSTLRRFELINTVRGEGVELSARGVKFLRRLSEGKTSNDQKSSEKVKGIFTRESEESDHYFTGDQSNTIEGSDHPTVAQRVEKLRRYLSSRGEEVRLTKADWNDLVREKVGRGEKFAQELLKNWRMLGILYKEPEGIYNVNLDKI